MEKFNPFQKQENNFDRGYIAKELGLALIEGEAGRYILEKPIGGAEFKGKLENMESFDNYFEGYQRVPPDIVSRPKGDTTFFTCAGIQHLETMMRESSLPNKEKFVISQPVIRSQYIDKVGDGVSTSFINFSAETLEAKQEEYLQSCKDLIKIIADRGVKEEDLEITIENNLVTQGERSFDNITLSIFLNGIELGECIYINKYPLTRERTVSIIDTGFGVERVNWATGASEYYLDEYSRIYQKYNMCNTNQVSALIDSVRSMVLIAGDGITPSGKDHGYRLRQFSKRFVERNMNIGADIDEIIEISVEVWGKWGNRPRLSKEEVKKVINAENERNFNNMFLSKLKDRNIDVYIDINQSTETFLKQINFSISQGIITDILNELKK